MLKRMKNEGSKQGICTSPERRDSAQEDVEDDAGAPDVHLRAVAPHEHLRRHVDPAADHLGEPVP
jgi:hypothetical protein